MYLAKVPSMPGLGIVPEAPKQIIWIGHRTLIVPARTFLQEFPGVG